MPYLIVVIDANEASIGKTNNERIEVIWSDTSIVPRKHSKGGQSKNRFQRGRQEALKGWLRKVRNILIDIHSDEQIIVGGPGMTKDKFIKQLPIWMQENIVETRSAGYTNENGLWEIMKISRYT